MSNTIRDKNGRAWSLQVTIDSVKTYERMVDIKVFAKLFELWLKYRECTNALEGIFGAIANLFPGIEEAAAFLYACAEPEDGGAKPDFNEFCKVVSPIECTRAVMNLTEELKTFMPDEPEHLKRDKGSDGSRPLEQ
jgi:hypothetical protein